MSSVHFAQPDVTLRLDLSGVIRQATLSSAISREGGEGLDEWIGRPWEDTVAGGGNAQVQRMLADARAEGVSSFHQVQQRLPSGRELSVEYTTVRLGGEGGLLAIGRNLEVVAELRSRLIAAQQSMERDYWRLREVETRYRLLFDASVQPVLLISPDDTRILEANPAAIRALGVARDRELLPELLQAQRDTLRGMLARVREQGKAPGIVMHMGPDRQPWLVRGSLIAAEPSAVFLLQLSPVDGAARVGPPGDPGDGPGEGPADGVRLAEIVERLPEGFVVVDAEGTVLQANRGFLDLIGQARGDAVLGQRMGRWLNASGSDAAALLAGLHGHGALSGFKTVLRSEAGTEIDVEISAASSADTGPGCVGLLLRRAPLQGQGQGPGQAQTQTQAQAQAQDPDARSGARAPIEHQVGHVTLRDIVQATIASVERRCIEQALALASGNRTIAAEMLGLSRQSLYTKLSRYTDEEPSQD